MAHYFLYQIPVIIIMMTLHIVYIHRKPLDNLKSSSSVVCYEGDTRSREVYEKPDDCKMRTVATVQPGNLELTVSCLCVRYKRASSEQ